MRVCELIAARSLAALIVSLAVVLPLSAQEQGVSAAMQQAFVTASQAAEAGQSLPAGTDVYRVGPGCTYSSIQDAIDAVPNRGSGVIRIRSGSYSENLSIGSKSVDLLGGHANCTSSAAPGTSVINASSSTSSAIFMIAGNDNYRLYLSQLDLVNGVGSNGLSPGGGLTVVTSTGRTATVSLNRTRVYGNQSSYHGGGIAMIGDGSGSLSLLDNSQIMFNQVTGSNPYGGGLYCDGDYFIIMTGGSIHSNVAGQSSDDNARGGGIYLDGCDMTWLAQDPVQESDTAALNNNTAHGTGESGGGGLYATGGAQVDLIGAHLVILGDPVSSRPLRIHSNGAQADASGGVKRGSGGAVYAFGTDTRVRLDRTWVHENYAAWGAFYARSGAEIIVERGSETCHSPRRCSRVYDNIGFLNPVAFAHSNGKIRFSRSVITDNRDEPTSYLTALFESQFGGEIEIGDSLVFDNHADTGLAGMGGSPTIRVRRSTFSANTFGSSVMWASDETSVSIFDSIIYEPGTIMAGSYGDPLFTLDCIVWHDDQLGGTRTLIADPRFVDPDNRLFYLKPDSPAINYCTVPPPAPGVDLDWNPRGVCHSTEQPCGTEVYDLGAYEYPLKIFSDRFETAP